MASTVFLHKFRRLLPIWPKRKKQRHDHNRIKMHKLLVKIRLPKILNYLQENREGARRIALDLR